MYDDVDEYLSDRKYGEVLAVRAPVGEAHAWQTEGLPELQANEVGRCQPVGRYRPRPWEAEGEVNPDAWKIAGLVIAAFASVAAILGALYGIVTVPILRTLKAEISASEARLEGKLMTHMLEMEKRVNERIDTRLVHR